MSTQPWDNPDLNDYEFLQGRMEGAGDWADSDAAWWSDVSGADSSVVTNTMRLPQHRGVPPELSGPNELVKRFRIIEVFKGEEYIVTEPGWSTNGRPFTFGPITGRLASQLQTRLSSEDAAIDDPGHLVQRAWFGQALGHHDRVVDLTTRSLRAITQLPDRWAGGETVRPVWKWEAVAAAAMLSSALRELGESGRALDQTGPYADVRYAPLMTSRAAAMCDINRWEEGRALAMAARRIADSEEVRRLLDRVERHFAPRPVQAEE